ncbi:TonB-dependent receptor [Chryseosolibacter indicus]|uniref:TonB-dependent receptor plug domain-containing protein n=1 Tax=Chryseosolibacter indicus TaxID=2782351 RepID=A0ABS5VQE1_9BACT|nr:TonB-dependent receptor [Chryseosolibacter indicus]MBT1703070.1 TonB-dependent receptor plug domain-containing protein [Chryseosolibacter indicus]
MRNIYGLLLFICFTTTAYTQEISKDTTLQEVVIQAYATERPLKDVAASVGYLPMQDLQRFNNTSIVPVINTVAGVRMEERSPGSYRFSIRGSSLRSPFGVRNVKVYWNGLPFTDAGGNTYLNLIDLASVGNIEIIKGPGGSLYGAGTGGVILFNRPIIRNDQVSVSALAGSYGLQRYSVSGQFRNESISGRAQFTHQQSDGYREQSGLRRNTFNTDLSFRIDKNNILSATILYSDLFYETPGGLTLAQFNANPKQARPAAGPSRGAVEQNASVNNKTFFGSLSHAATFNERFSLNTGAYTLITDFGNFAIGNYEARKEKNFGVRTEAKYKVETGAFNFNITGGGELQLSSSPIKVYQNNFGVRGDITSDSDLSSRIGLVFGQAEFSYLEKIYLTLGASANFVGVEYNSLLPVVVNDTRNFSAEFTPRIAVLGKVNESVSLYASMSRGFSPPTIAELFPSRQIFDRSLDPEEGTNIEAGVKGNLFNEKLYYEFTAYNFKLDETIVIRRDASLPGEPEYFVNAGRTQQRGLETTLNWTLLQSKTSFISNLKLRSSYSYNHYRFKDYVSNTSDLTGNKLTGVPPTMFFAGLDVVIRNKVYGNFSFNYVDHIPLNDDNSIFARPYKIGAARIGYRSSIGKNGIDIYTGIDNAFDEKYSLGNDLNAFGGRYFNAAATRNFYLGVKFDLSFEK